MEQEGANYLTPDSSFNVPIILTSESLETFDSSGINSENETTAELKEIELPSDQCLLQDQESSINTGDLISYRQNNNEEDEVGGGQNLKVESLKISISILFVLF